MIAGSLVVIFILAMAVAHYGYGMPMHDRDTGHLATPTKTLLIFLIIGGGGGLFFGLGVILYRWKP